MKSSPAPPNVTMMRSITDVFGYLQKREGRNFAKILGEITGMDGKTIAATTFYYGGKNTIVGKSNEEIAMMILKALGSDGSALD